MTEQPVELLTTKSASTSTSNKGRTREDQNTIPILFWLKNRKTEQLDGAIDEGRRVTKDLNDVKIDGGPGPRISGSAKTPAGKPWL